MKNLYLLFLLFFSLAALAQTSSKPIRFVTGDIIPENNISNNSFRKESLQSSIWGNQYYVIVQFENLPDLNTRTNLMSAGIQLETYIPANAYLARLRLDMDFSNLGRWGIKAILPLPSANKIDRGLSSYQRVADKNELSYWCLYLFPKRIKLWPLQLYNQWGYKCKQINLISITVYSSSPLQNLLNKLLGYLLFII
jgi:hypothetical protein